MPSFGPASNANLATCHPDLQAVFRRIITRVDCSIIEGARTAERQQQLFSQGMSTLDGVTQFSKHQLRTGQVHSRAVDVIPYPAVLHGVNVWKDDFRFTLFAGEVMATGWELGIDLRWGGDWDSDGSKSNQSFHDLPHFELR